MIDSAFSPLSPFGDTPLDLGEPGSPAAAAAQAPGSATGMGILQGYLGVFVVAFLVTLLATPLMRRLAVANGVVDHPTADRKDHRLPVAYLGGVAVYLGLLFAIAYAYMAPAWDLPLFEHHPSEKEQFVTPFSVLLGLTVITLVGLLDDVIGVDPRLKISGQLLAAAALALDDVGVKVAAGLLRPLGDLVGNQDLVYSFSLPFALPLVGADVQIDVVYWTGTAIIAAFILGACNASNLIDGLDGLLSGTTAIASGALLVIALGLAVSSDGPLDAARIVLCLGLLGATLGFLPHNFNPANIFLGDCGSMLLGFVTVVIILTLGDTGKTSLVMAGLIIYALPIIDTTLAIVRRRMAGRPMSEPDNEHIHHMLRKALGVKGAVLTLYGIGAAFGALGLLATLGRARVAYVVFMVLASFIGVTAVKIARRRVLEQQAEGIAAARAAHPAATSGAEVRTRPGRTAVGEPSPAAAAQTD